MKHLFFLYVFLLVLISNSDSQVWLKPNGRVGIGDYEPIAKLQVNSISTFSNPAFALLDSSGTMSDGGILQFRNVNWNDTYFSVRGAVGPNLFGVDSQYDLFFNETLLMSITGSSTTNQHLLYNPRKGALRTGYHSGGLIGDYSVAMGYNNVASGTNSFAMGGASQAVGDNTTALGSQSIADGHYSTVIGYENYTSGIYAIAMGKQSRATQTSAIAMGDSAMATGLTSFATGYKTLASGDYATATGNQTTASGQSAFSGGFGTVASQIASTAFGFVSQATGVSSLASGYSTIAAGENSVAMNSVTRALGPNSVTSGFLTKTIGWASSAFGESNTARAYASAVFGRYNDTIATSDPNTWVSLDPLFMIGNGSANTERNNALTIYKDGNLIAKHPTAVTSDPGILPLPVSGPGTRMMWIPGKSAFRIGTVNNDSWDAGNIGVSSFASGFNSKATGSLSTAFGESTASGSLSTALGQSNATATASTSMGLFTKATGFGSTAMGHYAIASGSFSTSMGYGTIAKAYLSTAIGSYNDSIAGSSELTWNEADPLFYVGNGINDATRHNALTIYKNANTDISGYTRLGEESENAPRIKMKELPLTTAGVNYNSSVTLPHGLTVSKILSVSVLIEWDDNYWAPPEYSSSLNRRYSYYVSPTDIVVQNNTPSGDCLICERPVRVLITYKE